MSNVYFSCFVLGWQSLHEISFFIHWKKDFLHWKSLTALKFLVREAYPTIITVRTYIQSCTAVPSRLLYMAGTFISDVLTVKITACAGLVFSLLFLHPPPSLFPMSLCSSWQTYLNASGQAPLLNNWWNYCSSPSPSAEHFSRMWQVVVWRPAADGPVNISSWKGSTRRIVSLTRLPTPPAQAENMDDYYCVHHREPLVDLESNL